MAYPFDAKEEEKGVSLTSFTVPVLDEPGQGTIWAPFHQVVDSMLLEQIHMTGRQNFHALMLEGLPGI